MSTAKSQLSTATDVRGLGTEQANPASVGLDTKSALEIARLINREDSKVAGAVERALPRIAQAIDAISDALRSGGRLIYVGAGTSGRIAALDAAECPPTFNTDPRMVQYVIAGGEKALSRAVEANEDSPELGRRDLARKHPGRKDVVVGVAASGRTPYTIGALEYARSKHAKTITVVCNPESPMERAADIVVVINVGAEVVSGSTRMKAGTAQKMVLNMLSTGAMARLGYVYDNLMVNVHLKNAKLVERGVRVIEQAAGADRETALGTLRVAGDVPTALVMLKAGVSRSEARRRLKAARGNVRQAVESGGRK
jgi:N-acetylmuramic acid 6-phosphate etherase